MIANCCIAGFAILCYILYFHISWNQGSDTKQLQDMIINLDLSLDYSFFDEIGSYIEGSNDLDVTVIGVNAIQKTNLVFASGLIKEFSVRFPGVCLEVVNGDLNTTTVQNQRLREFQVKRDCNRTVLLLHGRIDIPTVLTNSFLFDGIVYDAKGFTVKAAGLTIIWVFEKSDQWQTFNSNKFPDRIRQRFVFFNL